MITENPPAALLHTVYYPGALYRPLTMLTYMANHQVSTDPFGFHLVNVLLHALVTLAVFALARELLGSLLAAAVAAALFAVHPVHTEAVEQHRRPRRAPGRVPGAGDRCSRRSAPCAHRPDARMGPAPRRPARLRRRVARQGERLHGHRADRDRRVVGRPAAFAGASGARDPAVRGGRRRLSRRCASSSSARSDCPSAPPLIDNPLAHVGAAPRVAHRDGRAARTTLAADVPLHLVGGLFVQRDPGRRVVVRSPRSCSRRWWASPCSASVAVAARRAPVLVLAALFIVDPARGHRQRLLPDRHHQGRAAPLSAVGGLVPGAGMARRQRGAHATPRRPGRGRGAGARLRGTHLGAQSRLERQLHPVHRRRGVESRTAPRRTTTSAIAYDVRGEPDEAMVQLRQALAIHPDCAEAAFAIGAIYERKGIEAGALHWYAQAIARDWNYPRAHLNIGALRYQRGEYDAAEAAFRTGLAQEAQQPAPAARPRPRACRRRGGARKRSWCSRPSTPTTSATCGCATT